MRPWQIRLVLLAVLAIALGLVVRYDLFREAESWTTTVKMEYGNAAELRVERSHWIDIGPAHIAVGGGGVRYDMEVGCDGRLHRWAVKRDCRPFLVQEYQGLLYVACFDQEDSPHLGLRLYRATRLEFEEIGRAEFPTRIAVQNLDLFGNAELTRSTIIPDADWFSSTLTAELWRYLATGAAFSAEPSASFLRKFYREEIRPAELGGP